MREDLLEVEILSLGTKEVHIQGQSLASVISTDWSPSLGICAQGEPAQLPFFLILPILRLWFCYCPLAGVPHFLLLPSCFCVMDSQISDLWSKSVWQLAVGAVWDMHMTSTVLHSRDTLLPADSLHLGMKMWTKVCV